MIPECQVVGFGFFNIAKEPIPFRSIEITFSIRKPIRELG
jgi:hypothetical protein